MRLFFRFIASVLATLAVTGHAQRAAADGPYHVRKIVNAGGEGGFDYVYADPDGRRLYIARSGPTPRMTVFNLDTLESAGEIPMTGAHGVAVDAQSHHGFASSKPVAMWDSQTLVPIKTIAVGGRPDGILADAFNHRIYIFSHSAPNATVVDAANGSVLGTIDLGGEPEQAVADGRGHVYVDLEDKDSVAVVDALTMKVTGRYNLHGKGGANAGLALDAANGILFVACRDPQAMVMLDANTGRYLADLPIGRGCDGAVFNPDTMECFSSQGDGTLTVIKENGPVSFTVEQTVETMPGAKTLTLDGRTGRVLLIAAKYGPAQNPSAARPKRGPMLPGSFSILVVGKQLLGSDTVSRVLRPDDSGGNAFYAGNRAPLLPSPFVKLPVGAIRPRGWLLEYLRRQSTGLTGHLGEISFWLQKKDNAWLSRTGKGVHGWEELPYWLKGYGDLAYILDDPAMITETKVWIEGVIGSQRPDGDFGPDRHFEDDGTRDYWPNMIMLFCLQSYYEHSGDPRVITLMTNYFRYLLGVPDAKLLTHDWQKIRGGDNLYSVYWLYDHTGDAFLLDLGRKLHRRTVNWEMSNDLPSWHNVNIAEGFREPATYYVQSHDPADLKATYDDFHLVRRLYGQVPGGMFGGDENCRPGYADPRQAVETCGIVEQMLSDEILLRITGDSAWADHCEDVAFNTFPAAVMPDFRALRYLTAPNMVVSDEKDHFPGIDNHGACMIMNPFSSRCCQHNHSHGWPYFAENLWLGTSDNGLCAAIYAPGVVSAKVGDGTPVMWDEETQYPFSDTLRFVLHVAKRTAFPLYLRVPRWCAQPSVKLNEKLMPVGQSGGDYIRIDRSWSDGDEVVLRLPFPLRVRRWEANGDSATVDYGPLTFSLDIATQCVPADSIRTALRGAAWQASAKPAEWPSTALLPKSPWNYALVLPGGPIGDVFTIEKRPWPADNFPFTPESSPFVIHAHAKQVPGWKLDQSGLVDPLPRSPVATAEATQDITMIPMGAARIRISAFPVAQ